MHRRRDEQAPAGPAVDEVELLVPVPGAKEEGDDGVLGRKEEDDGKLGEGKEAYVTLVR